MKKGLRLDPKDNVGVVLESISAGQQVDCGGLVLTAAEDIAMPHKIALAELKPGAEVRKYGEVIGYATEHIAAGAWVHVHNLDSQQIMK